MKSYFFVTTLFLYFVSPIQCYTSQKIPVGRYIRKYFTNSCRKSLRKIIQQNIKGNPARFPTENPTTGNRDD